MVDEKKPKKGFFAARLPAFLQMTIGIGLLSVAYQHVSTTAYKFPTVNTLERRIAFSLRCLLVSVVPFIAALGSVALGRFSSAAINPLSGNEHLVETKSRILQNTFEQFVLHAVVLLSLATVVTDETVKLIPFLSAVFVVARILFIVGYSISPKARSLGFITTFVPTVGALGMILNQLYHSGFDKF